MNHLFNKTIKENQLYFDYITKKIEKSLIKSATLEEFHYHLRKTGITVGTISYADSSKHHISYNQVKFINNNFFEHKTGFEIDLETKSIHIDSFFINRDISKLYLSHEKTIMSGNYVFHDFVPIPFNDGGISFIHDDIGKITHKAFETKEEKYTLPFFTALDKIAVQYSEEIYDYMFNKKSISKDILEIFKLTDDINIDFESKEYEYLFFSDKMIEEDLSSYYPRKLSVKNN